MASKKGFTLLELMVVIIIIGVLATLGVMQYQVAIERARGAEAKQILGQLRSACASIWMERGGTLDCNTGNLSLAPAAATSPVPGQLPGGACWVTHHFRYAIQTPGTATGSTITLRANRCTTGGKTPDYAGTSSPYLQLSIDFMGQDGWTSDVVGY